MEKGNIGQLFIKMVQQAGAEQIKPKTIWANKEKGPQQITEGHWRNKLFIAPLQ